MVNITFEVVARDSNLQVLKVGFIWSFKDIRIAILEEVLYIFGFKTKTKLSTFGVINSQNKS